MYVVAYCCPAVCYLGPYSFIPSHPPDPLVILHSDGSLTFLTKEGSKVCPPLSVGERSNNSASHFLIEKGISKLKLRCDYILMVHDIKLPLKKGTHPY